jgi:hypothetical protein
MFVFACVFVFVNKWLSVIVKYDCVIHKRTQLRDLCV